MTIETVKKVQTDLDQHVHRFREGGVDPVVFGASGRAEAVLLPYSVFELLMDTVEEIVIARRRFDRDGRNSANRTSLADAADAFGVDLSAFGPGSGDDLPQR